MVENSHITWASMFESKIFQLFMSNEVVMGEGVLRVNEPKMTGACSAGARSANKTHKSKNN